MRRFVGAAAALIAALSLSGLSVATARTLVPAEQRTLPWRAALPGCNDPGVVYKIQGRFARVEANYWASSLTIVGVDKIRSIGWRPWGVDYIPRIYCQARALLSDGVYRRIDYNVIENGGIIGMSYGVEWCVSGLDRLYYYAPDCQMVRP
ncbi:MAG: hypothetical protein ABWZ80_04450 [Beijerinckiaceae bacterium]